MPFLDESYTLPETKQDRLSAPATADARKVISAADWNTLYDNLHETRTYITRAVNALNFGSVATPAATKTTILAAAAEAAVRGTAVFLPAGTYELPQDGANTWCLDWPASNVGLVGEHGQTILKASAGMPNASTSIIRVDDKEHVWFRDIIFDGNWGAAEGVTTTQAGINHTTQVDPKNHGLMLRGCQHVLVENCVFQQIYGDGIWMGVSSDDDLDNWTRYVRIIGNKFDMCARNGISFGAPVELIDIEANRFTNIFTSCIDSEPVGMFGGARTVFVQRNSMNGWWNGQYYNLMISVVGGEPTGFNESSAARMWRIRDNDIHGSINVFNAIDIEISGNRIVYDFAVNAAHNTSPIFIDHAVDDVTIENNYVYDVGTKSAASGDPHNGAIGIAQYTGSTFNMQQPAGVRVRGNRIHHRAGVHGIWINGVGGFAIGDDTTTVAAFAGTSTSITQSTVVQTGAGWTVDYWVGRRVVRAGKSAVVLSNTSDTLTLIPAYPTLRPCGWFTPLGVETTAPSSGAYVIASQSGVLDVCENDIDGGGDGAAAGGQGVYVFNDRSGGRVSLFRNNIKNSTDWGVIVVGNELKPIQLLEIVDNKFWDDQAAATMSGAIRFASTVSQSPIKLIMRGNTLVGGVSTLLSLGGGSAGTWLINDGDAPQWAGWGDPEGVVTAPVGATYVRKDGSTSTTLYVKTSGASNTGWTAK